MLGSWLFLMLSLVNMDIFLRFEAAHSLRVYGWNLMKQNPKKIGIGKSSLYMGNFLTDGRRK